MIDQSTLYGRTLLYRNIELGVGVIGVVHKAEETRSSQIAPKFLPQPVSKEPQAPARLQSEALATSAWHDQNLNQSNLNPGRRGRAWR
jgi:hypothetical protein